MKKIKKKLKIGYITSQIEKQMKNFRYDIPGKLDKIRESDESQCQSSEAVLIEVKSFGKFEANKESVKIIKILRDKHEVVLTASNSAIPKFFRMIEIIKKDIKVLRPKIILSDPVDIALKVLLKIN